MQMSLDSVRESAILLPFSLAVSGKVKGSEKETTPCSFFKKQAKPTPLSLLEIISKLPISKCLPAGIALSFGTVKGDLLKDLSLSVHSD